jgi:hypothetical protein
MTLCSLVGPYQSFEENLLLPSHIYLYDYHYLGQNLQLWGASTSNNKFKSLQLIYYYFLR